jgi:hypothetical protein
MSDLSTFVKLSAAEKDRLVTDCVAPIYKAFLRAGWKWSSGKPGVADHIPGRWEIGQCLRHLIDEVPMDKDLGRGRIHVSRFVEDGREQMAVSLDVGSVEADGDE